MGIDASLFQRIPRGTITERERVELPQEMHAAFPDRAMYRGPVRQFMHANPDIPDHLIGSIEPYDRAHREWIEPVRRLADVTIREDDLVFWPGINFGRLYDFHYASGKLPRIWMATWWMEDHIPEGEVVYVGGDQGYRLSSRVEGALMYHYCRYGHRWYTSNAYQKMAGHDRGSRTGDDEEDITVMCEAFREDFGGAPVDLSELDSSWQEVNWKALAYHLARLEGLFDPPADDWPLPVPELDPADLEPLLDSFHRRNRLYGAQLAHKLDGCSDGRAADAVEPLLSSDREELRLDALEVAYRIGVISSDVKDEVLAEMLASDSVWVRKPALRLSGRVRKN